MNDVGIEQMVDHYARLIGSPVTKPIVIGHSFGGLIAQESLADNLAAAAVAIDAAPIKGAKALTVPLKVTKEVVAMYSHSTAQTDFHIFEGRGHSLTIDNGWKDVADVALQWLAANGF